VIIINALLFLWVGHLVKGFEVAGFWSALWGALIVSITNIVLNSVLKTSSVKPSAGGSNKPAKRDDVIDI
jgi:putative membrane protein